MKEIKKNMKRGISPLISYILIVILSVTIGFLVINTLIDRIEDVEIGPEIEYCEDVSITVGGICVNSGSIIVANITSTGPFSVHKFSFGRMTNVTSLQWCDFTDIAYFPLDFDEKTAYGILLKDDYTVSVNESTKECLFTGIGGTPDRSLVELRVVPWIKPEGELISCKSKEVIIKENINGGC
ncbi:hypothetical protein HN865_02730 [Candidatus Woesearchaeota archaeon]|jgi:hypothetical protein|nr:hypothetical protein [Candidatus Woesearchaeota archaeon]MBT7237751.1 hypothetical protein [Candidatus Woesearchaeota archaeon]